MQLHLLNELQTLFPDDLFAAEVSLSQHTRIGIGGTALAKVVCLDQSSLSALLDWVRSKKIPLMTLGQGSRSLISEAGFEGVVQRLGASFKNIEILETTADEILIEAGSGVTLSELARWALEHGSRQFQILENMAGTIGGSLLWGGSQAEKVLTEQLTEIRWRPNIGKERVIKVNLGASGESEVKIARSGIITGVRLKFKKDSIGELKFKEQPAEYETHALSPVFKDLAKQTATDLIGEAGLVGVRVGQARVALSGNAIINEGGARFQEVLVLIGLMKDQVKQKLGVNLELAISITSP